MKTRFTTARAGACLLLAAACALAHAEADAQSVALQAADPQAAVPPTRYESILGGHAEAAAVLATPPDQNWVAGNQAAAATNSMALTMKNMAGHGGHESHGAHEQAPDPHAGHVMPVSQAEDPHAGHHMPGMHMNKQDQTPPAKERK